MIDYKEGHEELPLLILPNNHILVYTHTPCFKSIYPYLTSFSEPIDRPKLIHEYKITKFSLYTAMILEYTATDIIGILNRLSKNLTLPKSLEAEIKDYMVMAGRVRMQLREDFYELITDDEIGGLVGDDLIEKIGQVEVKSVGTMNFDFNIPSDPDEQE